jgi:hypothetical protein
LSLASKEAKSEGLGPIKGIYLRNCELHSGKKMQSDSITLGLMWHIGKVLQLLFESYWRDIEPVFYE